MGVRRPIATSVPTTILVSAADPRRLREHGRLPDTEWVPLWDKRLAEIAARVAGLLHAETEEEKREKRGEAARLNEIV